MILQTGGLAVGAIFTRSSSASWAIFIASRADMIPNCSPSAPIRRISLSLICSLIIKSLIVVYLRQMNSFRFLTRKHKKTSEYHIHPKSTTHSPHKTRETIHQYQTNSHPIVLWWEWILYFVFCFTQEIIYHNSLLLSTTFFSWVSAKSWRLNTTPNITWVTRKNFSSCLVHTFLLENHINQTTFDKILENLIEHNKSLC